MDHGKYDTNTAVSPRITSLFLHHLMNQMIKIVRVIGHKTMATDPMTNQPKSEQVKTVPVLEATTPPADFILSIAVFSVAA